MPSNIYWTEFADATIRLLVRPEPGDPVLILADTGNDLELAQAFLGAGIRAGADTGLYIKPRVPIGHGYKVSPILAAAIGASKMVLSICADALDSAPETLAARENGTRMLITDIKGIEDYVVRALLDVDQEAMARNAARVAALWDKTKVCRITSPQGTDVSFELKPRKSVIGDGAITEDGEVDFFPGAQVSIAPVEETINGTIVIDASDSVQGMVRSPYSFIMKKGVITAVEGDREAGVMRNYLETRDDETIYKLCHVSIGLNPQAGISGNMTEDERMLAAIDFGFGYQNPSFGGMVGLSRWHMDIMLATPRVYLDGKEMSGGGKLHPAFGFDDL